MIQSSLFQTHHLQEAYMVTILVGEDKCNQWRANGHFAATVFPTRMHWAEKAKINGKYWRSAYHGTGSKMNIKVAEDPPSNVLVHRQP